MPGPGNAAGRNGSAASAPAVQSVWLLAQACFGVWIGALLAIAIVSAVFPIDGPPSSTPLGLLSANLQAVRLEPREKGFYLFSLLLGSMGGFLATRRVVVSRGFRIALGLMLVLAVPLTNEIARASLQQNLSAGFSFAAALILASGYAVLLSKFGMSPRAVQISDRDGAQSPWLVIYGFSLLALTLLIIPSSFTAVAATIGMEIHVTSFLIGPSSSTCQLSRYGRSIHSAFWSCSDGGAAPWCGRCPPWASLDHLTRWRFEPLLRHCCSFLVRPWC
jgi:hypothetical protein